MHGCTFAQGPLLVPRSKQFYSSSETPSKRNRFPKAGYFRMQCQTWLQPNSCCGTTVFVTVDTPKTPSSTSVCHTVTAPPQNTGRRAFTCVRKPRASLCVITHYQQAHMRSGGLPRNLPAGSVTRFGSVNRRADFSEAVSSEEVSMGNAPEGFPVGLHWRRRRRSPPKPVETGSAWQVRMPRRAGARAASRGVAHRIADPHHVEYPWTVGASRRPNASRPDYAPPVRGAP